MNINTEIDFTYCINNEDKFYKYQESCINIFEYLIKQKTYTDELDSILYYFLNDFYDFCISIPEKDNDLVLRSDIGYYLKDTIYCYYNSMLLLYNTKHTEMTVYYNLCNSLAKLAVIIL